MGPAARPPPLKWAGGKRRLPPRLVHLWAPYAGCRLVEPFAEALAVAWGQRPSRARLDDANPHLVNFDQWLRWGRPPRGGAQHMFGPAARRGPWRRGTRPDVGR